MTAEQGETKGSDKVGASLLWQGVDFRIPIWGVAGALMTVVWALVSSHFAQQQLAKDVAAVQATITQGQRESADQFAQIARQASLSSIDAAEMRIRVGNLEASVNRLYGAGLSNGSSAKAEARATR